MCQYRCQCQAPSPLLLFSQPKSHCRCCDVSSESSVASRCRPCSSCSRNTTAASAAVPRLRLQRCRTSRHVEACCPTAAMPPLHSSRNDEGTELPRPREMKEG